jgi:hypothetical protein
MQRGTNMNCVGDDPHSDAAVRPDRGSEILLGELARQMQCLGVDELNVAGRVYVSGQRGEHDHAESRGNEHADAERPQQFGAENASLVSFSRLVGHGLAHPTPRKEDEEIDRQIADHQQSHGEPGHDSGAERHDAHDLGERGLIDLIGVFRRSVSGGRLISGSHRRAPTSCNS